MTITQNTPASTAETTASPRPAFDRLLVFGVIGLIALTTAVLFSWSRMASSGQEPAGTTNGANVADYRPGGAIFSHEEAVDTAKSAAIRDRILATRTTSADVPASVVREQVPNAAPKADVPPSVARQQVPAGSDDYGPGGRIFIQEQANDQGRAAALRDRASSTRVTSSGD